MMLVVLRSRSTRVRLYDSSCAGGSWRRKRATRWAERVWRGACSGSRVHMCMYMHMHMCMHMHMYMYMCMHMHMCMCMCM